ncbi:MAG TPA: hypothetical protein VMA36_04075 [Candidatus Limnocylindria bacterium]|jgi:hypothetical protein|nr:hypothetical protein [Candidatus Limnocylindria bacterium]
MIPRALALAAAVVLLGASAPMPGLRSGGTLVVSARVEGQPLNLGGNVALYHKGALYRLDLLSLGFPGTSSEVSAIAASVLAPGGITLVYDGTTGAVTAWSSASRSYYPVTQPRGQTAPPNAPPPSAAPGGSGGDPLAVLANVAGALRDVQTATIQLLGHKPLNGHPTTDIDVQMKRQQPGKPLEDYHAQLALADDLSDFPVQIAFSSVPPTASSFGGSMRLDLTDVQPAAPDDAMFAVPAGYARAASLSAVLGHVNLTPSP